MMGITPTCHGEDSGSITGSPLSANCTIYIAEVAVCFGKLGLLPSNYTGWIQLAMLLVDGGSARQTMRYSSRSKRDTIVEMRPGGISKIPNARLSR